MLEVVPLWPIGYEERACAVFESIFKEYIKI